MIERGGGWKELQGLERGPRLKHRIAKAKSAEGNVHTDPKGIAEVFADFYENLYAASRKRPHRNTEARASLPEVTSEEAKTLLRKMKGSN